MGPCDGGLVLGATCARPLAQRCAWMVVPSLPRGRLRLGSAFLSQTRSLRSRVSGGRSLRLLHTADALGTGLTGCALPPGYGVMADGTTTYVNASVCTVNYQPVNPPIVIDLPTPRNS